MLAPDTGKLFGDANEDSMILLFSYNGVDILFTADATKRAEERAINPAKQFIDGELEVLKVSHHGSKTGTSKLLLEELSVKQAIISAGKNNRYGHPHKDTLNTLTECGVEYECTAFNEKQVDIKLRKAK